MWSHMWSAPSDRDYYGDDAQGQPENEEGDAWNDLTPEDFSLFMTDPGFGMEDPEAESDIEQARRWRLA